MKKLYILAICSFSLAIIFLIISVLTTDGVADIFYKFSIICGIILISCAPIGIIIHFMGWGKFRSESSKKSKKQETKIANKDKQADGSIGTIKKDEK